MTFKFAVGDYVFDLTIHNEGNNIFRVSSLYIVRISEINEGMVLGEWINKKELDLFIIENVIECNEATKVIYSKQPRKKLRGFNIK